MNNQILTQITLQFNHKILCILNESVPLKIGTNDEWGTFTFN